MYVTDRFICSVYSVRGNPSGFLVIFLKHLSFKNQNLFLSTSKIVNRLYVSFIFGELVVNIIMIAFVFRFSTVVYLFAALLHLKTGKSILEGIYYAISFSYFLFLISYFFHVFYIQCSNDILYDFFKHKKAILQ